MRVAIFEELLHDTPNSYRVFLEEFERDLTAAGVEWRSVSPRWPVPGRRGQVVHLLVSAFLRQVIYPLWARRRFESDTVNFLVSSGLLQLLRWAPQGCRFVVFCHDIIAFLPGHVRGYALDFGGSLRRWLLTLMQRPAFRRVDLFLVPSGRTRSDLVEFLGVAVGRIVVIPHRLDDVVFREGNREAARRELGWPSGAPIVFAVVSAERRKNVEALLEAVRMLCVDMPELRLAMLGQLSPRQHLSIRRCGLDGRMILLRELPSAKVARCYQAADCLAHVSFYEGFGYPLLEAMACGCPIVCSPRGAIPEVVGECAVFADPTSPETVARGLRQVLTDVALQKSLRAAGLARAETFRCRRGYSRALARVWMTHRRTQ